MQKLLATLLALGLLAGCSAAPSATTAEEADTAETAAVTTATPESADGPVTIVDDLGRSVTVDHPQRVAVLIGSFADVWCLAGGSDSLVATAHDAWTCLLYTSRCV